MTTPLTLAETISQKILVVVALVSLVWVVYPETQAFAFTVPAPEKPSLVFEIKQTSDIDQVVNGRMLTFDDIVAADPLVTNLQTYLEQRNSPLAKFSNQIVLLPQWQRALAITFVESNFCRFAANNNCGSYGVGPGHVLWRKYTTPFDGFKDLTALLEKPIYKERYTTCEDMKGRYVVPGSPRWVNGCKKVSQELTALTETAEAQRAEIAYQFGFTANTGVLSATALQ